jgi:Fur family ferric uptake transcriptional regulator
MQCGRCGKMIEFQSPGLDSAIRDVCRQHQFHATGHTFVIRGTCADCNRARVTKRMLDLV